MALPAPSQTTTALVTGASSGIGADIARELASRGHGVTLVARREARLTALAAEITDEHGVRAEVLACDLVDPEARDALAGRVADLGLHVGILVNNAGFGSAGRFVELDAAKEAEQVRLNCEAIVALSRAFAPAMSEAREGGVLTVASSAGFQPLPQQATYAATKAFARSFSEGLHMELGRRGVHVTALCPGPVRTEFEAAAGADGLFDAAPEFSFVAPAEVARQAVEGLVKNRAIVVPGLAIKVATAASQFTPHSVLRPILSKFYPV